MLDQAIRILQVRQRNRNRCMVFLRWATRALIKAQLLLKASLIRQPRKRRIKSEFAFFQFSSRFFSSHFDVKVKLKVKVKVKSSYFTSVARNSQLTNKLEADGTLILTSSPPPPPRCNMGAFNTSTDD